MYRGGGAKLVCVPPFTSRPPREGAAKETIIQKIENVENLSFQHFQQVFNNKMHKEIRHNDEHSTIQQVFNKVFNKQKGNK